MYKNTLAFKEISDLYGDQTAKRSNIPLINHIVEGCEILQNCGVNLDVISAFCIHPIIQNNLELKYSHSSNVIRLAEEYSRVANSYLCRLDTDYIVSVQQLDLLLGVVDQDVLYMLYADKLQNNKDFLTYHVKTHDRSIQLTRYFALWTCYLSEKLFK